MTESRIRSLQRKLIERRFSCRELTERYLSAIQNENTALNAYILTTPEAALKAADLVDAKLASGETLMPLEGLPMALKDNISTAGIRTTCCSKMLWNYTPIYDAFVWQALKTGGAVLLGKTNMDEFAMGSSTETSVFGGTSNPYDMSRTAGGSSGGSACAVAANLAVYAIGSDTGGSVRQPAAFCGTIGFKPTYGGVSRYGLIAYASSFDQIGTLTATVEDAAIVYDVISGKDTMDSTCLGSREPVSSALSADIKELRIGIADAFFENIDGDIAASLTEAVRVYEKLGAKIVPVALPSLDQALSAYYILACAEAASNLGRYDGIRYGYRAENCGSIDELIRKSRSEGFGTEVKRRILLGNYVLRAGYYDEYYQKARKLRARISEAFRSVFENCDVLLTPTTPTTAFAKGFAVQDPVTTYQNDICTAAANIAGLPAISLPCGMDQNDLPIGMQLMGPAFGERTLLSAAYAFEQAAQPFPTPAVGIVW